MNEEAVTERPPAEPTAGGIQAGMDGAAPAGSLPAGGVPADALPVDGQAVGPLAQIAEWAGLGGPVVWILAAMSVLALAVTLMKLAQFLRGGVWRRGRAARAVAAFRGGDRAAALDLLRGRRGLPAQVVRAALRSGEEAVPAASLREEIEQYAADRLEALRGGLRLLEAIAALAPLLGLFGTVLGMIAAFQEMQGAGARVSPDILAGGIWTALLTTAVGLAVAMPAVALVTFFERTLDSLAHDLESFIAQIFTAQTIAAQTIAGRASPGRTGAGGTAQHRREETAHAEPAYGIARAV